MPRARLLGSRCQALRLQGIPGNHSIQVPIFEILVSRSKPQASLKRFQDAKYKEIRSHTIPTMAVGASYRHSRVFEDPTIPNRDHKALNVGT